MVIHIQIKVSKNIPKSALYQAAITAFIPISSRFAALGKRADLIILILLPLVLSSAFHHFSLAMNNEMSALCEPTLDHAMIQRYMLLLCTDPSTKCGAYIYSM